MMWFQKDIEQEIQNEMQEAFQLFLYLEDLEIKKINPD